MKRLNFNWIAFVAGRHISHGRKNSPSPVFSVLGIATGVLALTIIIAVMNGFQMGFIDSILEISSAHLRIQGVQVEDEAYLSARLRSLPEVLSVLPFEEHNILLRGRQSGVSGALLRAVPVNALELDTGLRDRLEIEGGRFNLNEPFSIVLGAELARRLMVNVGDEISILSFSGGIQASDDDNMYRVSGIFRSHFYEYDLSWAFISLETAKALNPDDNSVQKHTLAIKLNNRWQDQKAMEEILSVLNSMGEYAEGVTLSSWRDYNRAFFGALRTEKLMMFILVGLIFIVVGLNIFQAQRRTVLERREEIGLLRAMGASDRAVRFIFVWDGFVIGLLGAGLGLVPGLLIAFNIQTFFSLLEAIVNFFIININNLFFYNTGGPGGPEEFSLFSPQIFYLKEIPSRVIAHEVILIFMFGFLSALLAAWFASGKVSAARPAEVLRYE